MGGHIKKSWAELLDRTNIESDAWEVEIELLVLMVARGGACFYTFTLLFTLIHFYSLTRLHFYKFDLYT